MSNVPHELGNFFTVARLLAFETVRTPFSFIFGGRAMTGPSGESLAAFARLTGTTNYAGYVVVGTVLWMWMNMALWDSGMFFRQEQMRGTVDSNWMTPAPRLSCSLGAEFSRAFTSVVMTTVAVLGFKFLLVIAMAVPLICGYRAARAIFLGIRSFVPLYVERAVLVALMSVMIALELRAFSLVEHRCRRLGTISHFGKTGCGETSLVDERC